MANETVNQEQQATETQERTFTQSELDAIIGDRLARAKEKYSDYEILKDKASKFDELEEASKTELQRATERAEKAEAELSQMKHDNEIKAMREKVAAETGVPANLITGATEEECKAQAGAILNFAKPQGYPTVKDGGEVNNVGKPSTKQQFAEWANEAFN